MRRLSTAAAILASLTGCIGSDRARGAAPMAHVEPRASSEGWQAVARLPRPLLTKAVAVLDGTLYFFSGVYADGPTSDVTAYDLTTRRWSARASMPQSHCNQDAVALGGLIYMAGGCVRSDCAASPSGAAYAYDPKEDFWTVLSPLPEPVFDGLSAVINGRFVVFGGVANRRTSRRVYAYDPRSKIWSRLADLPSPRSHAAGAMFAGRFFLTGGCKGEDSGQYCAEIADDVFIYDPKADAWSSGPSLPMPLHAHGAAVDGGKLVLAGGALDSSGAIHGRTLMLANGAERWTHGPDILRARFGARLFPLLRGIGLFGPNATNNPESIVEALGAPGPYIDHGARSSTVAPILKASPSPTPRPVAIGRSEHLESLPAPAAPRPRSHAVVIGVERYRENLPRADFAAGDARLTAEYFRRVLGVPEENLALLNDDRATKSDFEKHFERWLPNRVEKGDEVYVYFSGHGAPNAKTGEAYLVPFDADPTYIEQTGYPIKKLYEQLAKLPAKRVLVVMDSCFSGAGGRSVIARGARPLVSVVQGEAPRGITVISASAADQISNSYQEKRRGLFTYFFLKGLKEKGGDFRAVFEYLKPQVSRVARREYNADQDPQWRAGK